MKNVLRPVFKSKEKKKTGLDNLYENALQKLFQTQKFKAIKYSDTWNAIKYPWHILEMMESIFANFFLSVESIGRRIENRKLSRQQFLFQKKATGLIKDQLVRWCLICLFCILKMLRKLDLIKCVRDHFMFNVLVDLLLATFFPNISPSEE